MAKIKRLQWIPMIFEAFHEARMRTNPKEASLPAMVVETLEPSSSTPVELPSSGNLKSSENNQQRAVKKAQLSKVRPLQRRQSVHLNDRESMHGTPEKYLLRELKTTKLQVRRLESFHRQLLKEHSEMKSQMNRWMEKQTDDAFSKTDSSEENCEA